MTGSVGGPIGVDAPIQRISRSPTAISIHTNLLIC